jgi:hypothetical protein
MSMRLQRPPRPPLRGDMTHMGSCRCAEHYLELQHRNAYGNEYYERFCYQCGNYWVWRPPVNPFDAISVAPISTVKVR